MRPSTTPPDGYHTVTSRLVVDDVEGAAQFLRDVFGAEGEVTAGRPVELRLGDSVLMVSGTQERNAFPAMLYVYVADCDETYRRALAAGATCVAEPADVPWGDRRAVVVDRWGDEFQIAHRRSA